MAQWVGDCRQAGISGDARCAFVGIAPDAPQWIYGTDYATREVVGEVDRASHRISYPGEVGARVRERGGIGVAVSDGGQRAAGVKVHQRGIGAPVFERS